MRSANPPDHWRALWRNRRSWNLRGKRREDVVPDLEGTFYRLVTADSGRAYCLGFALLTVVVAMDLDGLVCHRNVAPVQVRLGRLFIILDGAIGSCTESIRTSVITTSSEGTSLPAGHRGHACSRP